MEGRQYPSRPFVGVLAVVQHAGRVLLVRRGQQPNLGRWGFPGGVQELGETIEQTALRELFEETGLVGIDPLAIAAMNVIDRDDAGSIRHHYTLVVVSVEPAGDAITAGSDAAEAGWFSAEERAALDALPDVERILSRMKSDTTVWGRDDLTEAFSVSG